ncbi:hypothetical protein K0M31_013763 [Melipona bicolor]|uniref:Uncharacterized protein n=1 Tax=Melipona bicolor TaxID=60889 RepID=A0AA40KG13_9HYME|nr:hypothetical protein K0M31_013763 [Melipona bicolor]
MQPFNKYLGLSVVENWTDSSEMDYLLNTEVKVTQGNMNLSAACQLEYHEFKALNAGSVILPSGEPSPCEKEFARFSNENEVSPPMKVELQVGYQFIFKGQGHNFRL